MKKIYYLFTWMAVAIAFVSCKPLDKTYKTLDGLPKPAATLTYTLQAADYALLPSTVPAKTSLAFASTAEANTNIPTILNYKFFDYGDGSNANVTFTLAAPAAAKVKLADSLFKNVSYTLTNADYLLLPGNKFLDFSVSQVLAWLPYKYPTPVEGQLEVLTFIIFPTTTTPVPPYSFLYLNGVWQQIYQVTPAQYVSVNRGAFNQFTSADDANLTAYLGGILKADIILTSTAKKGDLQYVSFNYYSSAKVTSQRVIPFYFDGTNWTTTGPGKSTATLAFGKTGGAWIPDQTVYYTLTKADAQYIGDPNGTGNQSIGTASQRANLYQFGDFSGWAAADLNAALIYALTKDFPNPKININYKVTYLVYTGKDTPTVSTFKNTGTAWVVVP